MPKKTWHINVVLDISRQLNWDFGLKWRLFLNSVYPSLHPLMTEWKDYHLKDPNWCLNFQHKKIFGFSIQSWLLFTERYLSSKDKIKILHKSFLCKSSKIIIRELLFLIKKIGGKIFFLDKVSLIPR